MRVVKVPRSFQRLLGAPEAEQGQKAARYRPANGRRGVFHHASPPLPNPHRPQTRLGNSSHHWLTRATTARLSSHVPHGLPLRSQAIRHRRGPPGADVARRFLFQPLICLGSHFCIGSPQTVENLQSTDAIGGLCPHGVQPASNHAQKRGRRAKSCFCSHTWRHELPFQRTKSR